MSRRYQQGCLYREKRKAGPDVWVFRFRDGRCNRKEIVDTVGRFATRKSAMQACEQLRANINRYTWTPQTIADLVEHYRQKEMSESSGKAFSTRTAYEVYPRNWMCRDGERACCQRSALSR